VYRDTIGIPVSIKVKVKKIHTYTQKRRINEREKKYKTNIISLFCIEEYIVK